MPIVLSEVVTLAPAGIVANCIEVVPIGSKASTIIIIWTGMHSECLFATLAVLPVRGRLLCQCDPDAAPDDEPQFLLSLCC